MTVSTKFRAGLLLSMAFACVQLLSIRPAKAADVSVRLDLGGVAQFLFDSEPRLVMVPNTHTYYAQDVSTADVYRMNNVWYSYYQNSWYRSDNYRGPWARCNDNDVPQEMAQTPGGYSHFARPSRGDSRNVPNNDADTRYIRSQDGSYNQASGGDYTRNSSGGYDHHSDRSFDRQGPGQAPDGPSIQAAEEPRMYAVPHSTISYARDYRGAELYRSGSTWYTSYGGNWYGSGGYNGPWRTVAAGQVPSGISTAPSGYYRSLGYPAMTARAAAAQRQRTVRRHR